MGTAGGFVVFLRAGRGSALDRISHTPWALCRRRLLERESGRDGNKEIRRDGEAERGKMEREETKARDATPWQRERKLAGERKEPPRVPPEPPALSATREEAS